MSVREQRQQRRLWEQKEVWTKLFCVLATFDPPRARDLSSSQRQAETHRQEVVVVFVRKTLLFCTIVCRVSRWDSVRLAD